MQSAKDFARVMQEQIREVQKQGAASINSNALIGYLQKVIDEPDQQAEAVADKADHQLQIAIHNSQLKHEINIAMFNSVISAGQHAMKASFLLNGGAAVAILAFIGHLAEHKPTAISGFSPVLSCFSFGVLLIAATSGFTYVSQWLHHRGTQTSYRAGMAFNVVGVVAGLSSYAAFSVGMFKAIPAFDAIATLLP